MDRIVIILAMEEVQEEANGREEVMHHLATTELEEEVLEETKVVLSGTVMVTLVKVEVQVNQKMVVRK